MLSLQRSGNSANAARHKFFILVILALLTATIAYWGGLNNLHSRWTSQAEYSHGYMVFLVAIYFIWEKKDTLASAGVTGSGWGLPIIAIAMMALLIGEISALYIVIHYSLLLFLIGLSLLIFGKNTRQVLPSIGLIIFVIPLPYVIEVALTAKMQLWSSSLGVNFIRLFDIPVYLSGNVIDMGDFELHVVEACSGLRYLFPLVSLGYIAVYFYRASLWKRAVVFVSTVPITIIMNSVRIGVVGLLVEHFGTKAAEGFIHDFEGWVIFMACALILIAEVMVLEFFTTKLSIRDVFAETPKKKHTAPGKKRYKYHKTFPLACSIPLLAISILLIHAIDSRKAPTLPQVNLATFPAKLQGWVGYRESLSQIVVDTLGVTDYLKINYYNPKYSDDPVNLYVAYYKNQRKGVSPHSPKVCMPGGGWEIVDFMRTELDGLPVNRVIIRKGLEEQLVYYWFIERGLPVANEYIKKWWLLKDAIVHNRTDGSLVRIVTRIDKKSGLAAAEDRAAKFIQIANSALIETLPNKTP